MAPLAPLRQQTRPNIPVPQNSHHRHGTRKIKKKKTLERGWEAERRKIQNEANVGCDKREIEGWK
jgi:hypothetical protein